ncbi:MAG: hypothetical protein Q9187_006154, partial [Circinaria calcarea]
MMTAQVMLTQVPPNCLKLSKISHVRFCIAMGFSKDEMAPSVDLQPQQGPTPLANDPSKSITEANPRKRAKSPHRGGRGRDNSAVNKRTRNDAAHEAAKRRKLANEKEDRPIYAVEYSKEEIEKEERRPKRKVAVMIGYSGSGYKGMQLNHHEKTIEGDLFGAFVAAGAVSKANADDPKKSSLVRCARTDKGVHAAGNVISMKLIVEDKDIVQRINDNLSPQIRVWGMERTNGSFSAYQLCDSRIYEYLIPTHCFLPPHPESFLGKKLVELAEEANDRTGFEERQRDVSTFWSDTEAQYIKPILDLTDLSIRPLVIRALYDRAPDQLINDAEFQSEKSSKQLNGRLVTDRQLDVGSKLEDMAHQEISKGHVESPQMADPQSTKDRDVCTAQIKETSPLDVRVRELKEGYVKAKKAYRIHPDRLARVRSTLSRYVGTHKYHNYTIGKSSRDPSAKRVIKSFVVNGTPIIINDTEWLSLKVHGQSFMMHQIRKM